MTETIEFFLLLGFLVLMAMVWGLKKRIQAVTEATVSALEGQCLAIDRRVMRVLEELAFVSIAGNGPDQPKEPDTRLDSASKHLLSSKKGERPIFVATVFKSGTKLLEHIVAKLTRLDINAPDMSAGSDYESAEPILFESGKFFIWHNAPSARVKSRLIVANAQPIFLIRNIYDLAVSQYFHFAHDVDAEIGCSTHTADYFAEMTQDEGISLLLSGATSERFNWHGFGYYLHQIQEMLQFSKEYPCHIAIYDHLIRDKRREIERLSAFLGIEPSDELLSELIDSSSLDSMRAARISMVGSGNHFRKGSPGDHINVLKPWHYHMINQIKLTFAPRLDTLCDELGFGDVIAVHAQNGTDCLPNPHGGEQHN